MLFLQKVCKSSNEFVTLLKSPVVKPDKKAAILDAVTGSEITEANGFLQPPYW